MDFENDVFVSYAHIDDQSPIEGQKGWISSFHRALEIRLGQLRGKTPRIWRDPKLAGNDLFSDRIVDRLPRVATLVSVLSPRYVRSDWCTRELREFLNASERSGGLRVADKIRVFKVVKTPVPLDQHPSELQRVLGYEFYTTEASTGRPRELGQAGDPDLQRQYWARLDDLAHDISDLLEALDDDAGAPPAGAAGAAGVRSGTAAGAPALRTVYLADTVSELKEQRDALRRELMAQGWSVLPDRPLPLLRGECESLVREQLACCRMSVHLIGRHYGIVPEGTTASVVTMQSELAVARGAAGGFSRLIWLPEGMEIADERQGSFVAHLRTDAGQQSGADLLETPFADFQQTLLDRLRVTGEADREEAVGRGAGPAPRGGEVARIYLICEQRDLGAAAGLADHLFEQGFEVVVPVFEGDEPQVRREHEESLVSCDAALIYHGAAGEIWLRQKLRELQKSAGYGRTGPLLVKGIFLAPPETPQKLQLRTHEALVLRPAATLAAALAPFVRQLRAPEAAR
ncbi:MAG TPA: hypothetical protein VJA16_22755 [Thermoanaerobaculia bacterium]